MSFEADPLCELHQPISGLTYIGAEIAVLDRFRFAQVSHNSFIGNTKPPSLPGTACCFCRAKSRNARFCRRCPRIGNSYQWLRQSYLPIPYTSAIQQQNMAFLAHIGSQGNNNLNARVGQTILGVGMVESDIRSILPQS